MHRIVSTVTGLSAALLLSACVFAPPSSHRTDTTDVAKMGEQALATCGAGNVKDVSAKSFSCK
jgi:hypothetical protein